MDVFGLLGNPVGHSLSPPMHEAAYDALDVDARYVTFEPAPDDLEAAVEGARALGLAGVNVTVPFKERVLECVEPSSLAARVGAVNTIDFADDAMVGYNTDVAGAVRALECEGGASLDGSTAVVVGAGGAGRAVAFGLADAGATVHVANRTVERATSLAADVAASTPQANAADARETPGDCESAAASRSQGSVTRGVDVTGHGLDELADVVPAADVLVNATTVGMADDESPVPATVLHDGLVVLDAVYAPLETQLLRSARAAGATTVDGAWMLLYQGAAAFERWTGRDAPVDAMNDALRDALE